MHQSRYQHGLNNSAKLQLQAGIIVPRSGRSYNICFLGFEAFLSQLTIPTEEAEVRIKNINFDNETPSSFNLRNYRDNAMCIRVLSVDRYWRLRFSTSCVIRHDSDILKALCIKSGGHLVDL